MAMDLAKEYTSLEALSSADFNELITIEGVGPNIAQSIVDWFSREGNQQLIAKFKSYGLAAE